MCWVQSITIVIYVKSQRVSIFIIKKLHTIENVQCTFHVCTLHAQLFASWTKAYDPGRLSRRELASWKRIISLLLILPSLIFFSKCWIHTKSCCSDLFANFGVKYLHINYHFLYFVSVAEGMKVNTDLDRHKSRMQTYSLNLYWL